MIGRILADLTTNLHRFFCTHRNMMWAIDGEKKRVYTLCPDCGQESPGIIITQKGA